MPDIIPVTIVSGFLGSGKTTMLNRALTATHGRRIAVVVNELGEIGLDAHLITGDENFVELDNGCLCCALNEDLVAMLGEIGRRPEIDQVMIETTGIADPLPIGHSVTRPELEGRFRLDALVTTVDALHMEHALDESWEAAQQIRRADILLLTKLDLVDRARESLVRSRLKDENPAGRQIRSDDQEALRILLDAGLDASQMKGETVDAGHDHGHAFETLSIDVGDRATIRFAFEGFLEELPDEVYRSKGIVKIDGEPGRLVFHSVGGRVDLWHDPERSDGGALVFIGKDIPRERLRADVGDLFGMDVS